ncbi:MAG TPA: ArsA-related P-loop ATPase [Acidimicrobiales bacterium]|nr:ArsA-related P-loop ATPase [Acidimicrobiales bacterium]
MSARMDVAGYLGQSHVLLVVGKGGVGKTTVTAALAETAAGAGLSTLVVALDDSGGLPGLLGHSAPFGYDRVELGERLSARTLTSDAALLEYLDDHGMKRVSKRLVNTGVLDVIATAIPGIREVLVLGKLKQLERERAADLILLDAPATGHAVTFLTSAGGLVDAARGGPLRSQAEDVVAMLRDPLRCQVVLVTIPEETPVNEAIETAYRVEDDIGVALGPVVVNACYPVLDEIAVDPLDAAAAAGVPPPSSDELADLRGAARFRRSRQNLQAAQLGRLADELPLPQLRLPYLFGAEVGPDGVAELSGALAAQIPELPPLAALR